MYNQAQAPSRQAISGYVFFRFLLEPRSTLSIFGILYRVLKQQAETGSENISLRLIE